MGAQRGGILRAILRPRFDELSARRILSERLSHRHLMRAQLGGFLRRDLGQRFDEASAWRIPRLRRSAASPTLKSRFQRS